MLHYIFESDKVSELYTKLFDMKRGLETQSLQDSLVVNALQIVTNANNKGVVLHPNSQEMVKRSDIAELKEVIKKIIVTELDSDAAYYILMLASIYNKCDVIYYLLNDTQIFTYFLGQEMCENYAIKHAVYDAFQLAHYNAADMILSFCKGSFGWGNELMYIKRDSFETFYAATTWLTKIMRGLEVGNDGPFIIYAFHGYPSEYREKYDPINYCLKDHEYHIVYLLSTLWSKFHKSYQYEQEDHTEEMMAHFDDLELFTQYVKPKLKALKLNGLEDLYHSLYPKSDAKYLLGSVSYIKKVEDPKYASFFLGDYFELKVDKLMFYDAKTMELLYCIPDVPTEVWSIIALKMQLVSFTHRERVMYFASTVTEQDVEKVKIEGVSQISTQAKKCVAMLDKAYEMLVLSSNASNVSQVSVSANPI